MAFIEPMHRNKPNITYLVKWINWEFSTPFSKSGKIAWASFRMKNKVFQNPWPKLSRNWWRKKVWVSSGDWRWWIYEANINYMYFVHTVFTVHCFSSQFGNNNLLFADVYEWILRFLNMLLGILVLIFNLKRMFCLQLWLLSTYTCTNPAKWTSLWMSWDISYQ